MHFVSFLVLAFIALDLVFGTYPGHNSTFISEEGAPGTSSCAVSLAPSSTWNPDPFSTRDFAASLCVCLPTTAEILGFFAEPEPR